MTKADQFLKLKEELTPYINVLGQAADRVLDENVSDYPIFIVHQHEMDMGILIIDKDEVNGNWSVNLSILEEFATRNIIEEAKVGDFKKVYKDPEEYLCMFVLSELGANFIWLPRTTLSS